MRISTCLWCGRGRRQINASAGVPGGIEVIMESDRWPSVKLHSICAWNLRHKAAGLFGDELLESELFKELLPPPFESLRRGY